jgi:ABC-2 type transport system ATP-binding protein
MTSGAPLVLSAIGLRKRFGAKVAVADVDLHVARGEIVGFLGPNGAGKTTIMNMITGLSRPDAGELSLFGVPGGASKPALRSRIGFLQEQPRIYPEMSGRAYLRLFAALYGIADKDKRVEELIATMSLGHAADRALATYSRGMQQRTCLARTMLHNPEFLVLDEPTLGLDPAGMREMRDIILELNRAGVALLFSSHQLAEMERICDRVILMDSGRILATGTKDDLVRMILGTLQVEIELAEVTPRIIAAVRAAPMVADALEIDARHIRVGLGATPDCDLFNARVAIAGTVTQAGGVALSIAARTATLEDAFLQMTQGTHH